MFSERLESRASTPSTQNTKKEISKDENKTKDNDPKAKRPSASLSSGKDALENTVKVHNHLDLS